MTNSSILNSANIEPPSNKRRNILIVAALIVLLGIGAWYAFRFAPEKRTVARFLDADLAGNFETAYRIWKPNASYTYQDFLGDWGAQGYYGPIQSYRIQSVEEPPDGATGIIITVEISPVRPFPSEQDPQSARNRQVKLWVERSDQSIGFPP